MHKSILSIGSIIVLAAIILLFNSISRVMFRSWSVDLTESGLYSLSQGSSNVLSKLEDDVTLKLFFSKTEASKFPSLSLYGTRVRDFLEEYVRASGGKITLEVKDPRPDSEDEEWAQKYGLSQIQMPGGQGLYLGLVGTNQIGDESAIPLFELTRQEFLEYDITKLIYSLQNSFKPIIGVISTLDIKGKGNPEQQQQSNPWMLVKQLESVTETRFLNTDVTSFDPNQKVLVVIHPKNLSQETLYAIDQFVMGGGFLLVFVDPFSQHDPEAQKRQAPTPGQLPNVSSSLNSLTSNWGISLNEGQVVSDINLPTKINSGPGGYPQDFISWLSLTAKNVNKDNVLTSKLNQVLMPWPGSLKLEQIEGIKTESLISTTKDAMLKTTEELMTGGGLPQELIKNYQAGGEELSVAAMSSGKFKSNFPDGAPSSSNPEHLSEAKQESVLVVIADTDLLGDRYAVTVQNVFGRQFVRPMNDNISLMLNAVESLSGSNDLISIRSRGKYSRPFTKVQQLEISAQQKWQKEEEQLKAKLNSANQRLNQLQSAAGQDKAFSEEMLAEIKRFREERLETQKNLRKVRRGLREEVEKLGSKLFFMNTFLIPLILIALSFSLVLVRKGKKQD